MGGPAGGGDQEQSACPVVLRDGDAVVVRGDGRAVHEGVLEGYGEVWVTGWIVVVRVT